MISYPFSVMSISVTYQFSVDFDTFLLFLKPGKLFHNDLGAFMYIHMYKS